MKSIPLIVLILTVASYVIIQTKKGCIVSKLLNRLKVALNLHDEALLVLRESLVPMWGHPGMRFTDAEQDAIETFLQTLSGSTLPVLFEPHP